MDEQERIMGVAMLVVGRNTDERHVVTLPPPNRHPHLFRLRVEFAAPELVRVEWSEQHQRDLVFATTEYHHRYRERQGFFTNKRDFIGRGQALVVARLANQIIQKTPGDHELFSEDLW